MTTSDNPKRYGAIEMFKQSIIYLYNSYREDGLNATDAKERVAKEVQSIYSQCVDLDLMPVKQGIYNPERQFEAILKEVELLKGTHVHQTEHAVFKNRIKNIERSVQHLKNIIK